MAAEIRDAFPDAEITTIQSGGGRFEVSVDGAEFERHRARTVVVGNVGYLQAGIPLLPDSSIDDGVLDLVLLHKAADAVKTWPDHDLFDQYP